ncbi:hypothetical protein CAOG_02274 [Capsaspora owczarzaki ATCC 30864]|uniref:Amine oxidase domain-containing protein n=1 Tax=Capsaspora owczarzaki (strain ATCC 30864) TaxID=595528 RepID=A0A0D2WKZ7_CAPO3|nr:hypothetical protein CAOG_02274 [Capsaspora owczarzaki ATCC 30864]KJE91085.1 hypothetical protein CAOG_002274 [Capsaspora owczarzaki ATCC 30864]|eukprot:XP_004349024.1 hypothetical protein CAOG_02274 [Capsaspora owczarzaki ATCC 30864]
MSRPLGALVNNTEHDEDTKRPLLGGARRAGSRLRCFALGAVALQAALVITTLIVVLLNYHKLQNLSLNGDSNPAGYKDPRRCSTVIVGGGIGGLYMADQLARSGKEPSVCLVEREAWLGGRILDKVFSQVPTAVAGMGAWRFNENHANVKALADRFSVPYELWNFAAENKMEARGIFTNSTDYLRKMAFPVFAAHPMLGNMSDSDLWSYVTSPTLIQNASVYPDFGSYLRDKLSPEGWQYLQSVRAYEGDLFEVDADSYVEFSQLEDQDGPNQYRPLEGMSALVRALTASCDSAGVRIYLNEPARSIGRTEKHTFIVQTDMYYIETDKLVINLPPLALAKVEGSIVEQITQQLAYQSILPEVAMKGVALYAEAWWEKLPEGVAIVDLQRYVTHSECLTTTLPYTGRGPNGEAVLHTIYADGPCGTHWQRIVYESKSSLDAAVKRQLSYIFPGAQVPDSMASEYALWDEGAWHFQKPLTGFNLTNIEDWASQPIDNLPVYLVGEAYNRRRTWSEGALRSAKDVLARRWNITSEYN